MRNFPALILACVLVAFPVHAQLLTLGAGPGGAAGGGGGGFATFDAAKTSPSMGLDGTLLIETSTGSGSNEISCLTTAITSGKKWVEFKVRAFTTPYGPSVMVYNGNPDYGVGRWAGSSDNIAGAFVSTAGGMWWLSGTPSGGANHADDAIFTVAVNGYIMILIDKTATTYTGGSSGSTSTGNFWYRSAAGDSLTYPLPTGTLYVCGGAADATDSMSVNAGQATPVNSIPSGYVTP